VSSSTLSPTEIHYSNKTMGVITMQLKKLCISNPPDFIGSFNNIAISTRAMISAIILDFILYLCFIFLYVLAFDSRWILFFTFWLKKIVNILVSILSFGKRLH